MSSLLKILEEENFYSSNTTLNLNESLNVFKNLEQIINIDKILSVLNPNLVEVVNFISLNLSNLTTTEYEKISNNLFKKLSHLLKEFSRDKKNFDPLKDLKKYLSILNCLTIYLKSYNGHAINMINDNKKNIIVEFADFVKLFLKLISVPDFMDLETLNHELNFLNMMLINFPSICRPIEFKINIYLNMSFIKLVKGISLNQSKFSGVYKNFCMCFTLLLKTQTDYSLKLNIFLKKIEESFHILREKSKPMSFKDYNNANSEIVIIEKNVLFTKSNFDSITILSEYINAYYILFKIYEYALLYFHKNVNSVEIDFSYHINFITSFFEFESPENNGSLLYEGLTQKEFNFLNSFLKMKSIKIFKNFINVYSNYLLKQTPIIKKHIVSLFKKKDNLLNYTEIYLNSLSLFNTVIKRMGSKILSLTDELMKNLILPDFLDIYICYLEKNDQTIVKNNKGTHKYTKLNVKKSKEQETVNMLDHARNLVYNEQLKKYSDQELKSILIQFIKIFESYFSSDCFMFLNKEKIISFENLVNSIILPPFAKFVFSIENDVKRMLLELIYSYVGKINKSNISIQSSTIEKILSFIKNHFIYEKNHNTIELINKIYLILNSYVKESNSMFNNNITSTEIENIYLNMRKFNDNIIKLFEQKETNFLQIKRNASNDVEIPEIISKNSIVKASENSEKPQNIIENKFKEDLNKPIISQKVENDNIPKNNVEVETEKKTRNIDNYVMEKGLKKTRDGIYFTDIQKNNNSKSQVTHKEDTDEKLDFNINNADSSDDDSLNIPELN